MSFEQGQNWKAKNAASIRLRVGDGRKHGVQTRAIENELTDEQVQAMQLQREEQRAALGREREAQEARRRGAARDKRAEDRAARRDHTPEGWKPANQRVQRYSDPLAQENDPRRKADEERKRQQGAAAGQRKPKRRRIIRPGN